MFSSLASTDFVDVITAKASVLIDKDRMAFSKVYQITEEYCKSQEIIVSDPNKIVAAISPSGAAISPSGTAISPTRTNCDYKLYCRFPYKHAVALANLIHSNVGEWVKMRTIVGHQEFVIDYDSRPLITIYSVDFQKSVKLSTVIMPVELDGIKYMSPELEIIDVYHRLYSPEESDNWPELVETESRLYDLLISRVKKSIFGGRQEPPERSPEDITDLQYLKYLVMSEFCCEFIKDYVVVGHWALHVVEASREENHKMKSSIEKIQIITSIDINNAIEEIMNFLGKYTNARVVARIQDLHIPKDFRINRCTIYIGVPSKNGEVKDKAFMDIFNCGNFELVPYIPVSLKTQYGSMIRDEPRRFNKSHSHNKSKKFKKHRRGGSEAMSRILKIGSPFVLLRFLIIDLWILRMIHEMGHLTEDMLKVKTKYILHVIETIRDPGLGLMDKVFGVDYVGVHKDYVISKKIENLKSKPFFPYYPEKDLSMGSYKNV